MNKSNNGKFKLFIYIFLLFLCFAFLGSRSIYASYETAISGKINPQIAAWKILVNGENATVAGNELELDSSSFTWNCPGGGVRDNKVGPGCSGTMSLVIDASSTEVATLYEFDIVDKNIIPEKILKITNIKFSNSNFFKTDISKYSGYLSLDDIKNKPKLEIIIDVVWEDTGDIIYNEDFFDNDDNYITIDFFAKQYLGEVIVPYSE